MLTFMKGKEPNMIVTTAPVDGSAFNEEMFADAYEKYGGFLVCTCEPVSRDAIIHRLNAYEQITFFANAVAKAEEKLAA